MFFHCLTAATESFMPFISKVPTELRKEFTDDMVRLAISYNSKNLPAGIAVEMPFQCLIAYACKSA